MLAADQGPFEWRRQTGVSPAAARDADAEVHTCPWSHQGWFRAVLALRVDTSLADGCPLSNSGPDPFRPIYVLL